MANGTGFTWVVDVLWQAVPESMNYFGLGAADRTACDLKLIDQVNGAIPPDLQARWQRLVLTVANFDELAAQVRAILKREVVPPAGTEFALAEAASIWKPRPPNGHEIQEAAMLKDSGATAARPWTFAVSYGGATYSARMGLSYNCLRARVP